MDSYREYIIASVERSTRRIEREPYYSAQLTRRFQRRVNRLIPERVHAFFTAAIREMTEAVSFGVGYISRDPVTGLPIDAIEKRVGECITFYARTAAAEGAVTGAGGILLGLADLPLWLTVKMKMLFEIAALYGYDATDYRERIFLLHIFELTFSGYDRQRQLIRIIRDWEETRLLLPDSINAYNWRSFQQEYRDYIDVAKLLQLVPGIGAVVGTVVNYRLTRKLGDMAKYAYRLRWIRQQQKP